MKNETNNIFLYIAIALLSISSALAQENCTNGVDDDGDGFIDCYDGDCAGGPSCADFFYGNPIVCKDEPTENPTFTMKLQWGSEDRSADSHATPAVGDLDNDGLPEVVVINRLDERLFILNGEDGTTAFTYDLGYQPENGIVLANLDGGDCANIYVSRDNSSTITALDCEANFLWQTNASDRVGIMGIADFNGDGNAELYYKTEIMDAATGNIIVTGTGNNWVQNYAHSAIAVDILDDAFCADCSGLELITGNEIWAINIAAGTRTLAKDLNDLFAAEIPVNNKRYYTKYFNTTQNRTAISVADYNQDGHVDVLMPGAYGSSNSSQTTIFFWDVFNDAYLVYDGGVNHNKGTGRLNVSDIDGDGLMNTTYVSDQILYALDENLNVLWTKGIDEGSSGFTGTTVFDFDGDGAAETIYRSESYLYIIDGTDGSTRTTVACKSRTQEEYPLVADVDNDGSSELCVPCYTSNNTPFSPYSNTKFSQIRIYEADGGEIWQPSRRVWNQHGYYNVNVNDDLTIPAQQQDHTAIFGTVNCDTGLPEDNRALNGFLNQSTFLEADGCPSYVSPDLNMAGNVVATPSLCPLTTFDVSFDIENTGDTDIFGTLPVTFYDGDPETPGATKLNTETVVINNFLQGETRTINMTVEGPGGDFDLYISINNNGQDPPITPGSGGFPECDFSNNIANVSVTYTPFTLTVNKLEENRRCDPSKPDNGEAEAYFEGTLGGDYETFWVEDFAGLPNGDRSDAGATAWTSTKGAINPTYWGVNTKSGNKVYQTRNTGTSNEVGEVTWLSDVIDISGHTDVDLSLEMLTNNALEASGQWRDYMRAFYILDGGAEVEFDVNGELYGSFMFAVAEQEDLNGSTVQIKVTFHSTANGERQFLDNVQVSGTSIPVVKQYTDADGFEFDWYNAGDFSAPVANGSLYTGMASGSYDVVGYFPGGNCYSDTVNIVINDSVPTFNVHVYEVAPYTDCADPDGALSAFVYTQTDGSGDPADTLTAGYSFSWVLSTEGITPVGTGPDLTNISSESYTVRVEQLITGCTSSASGAPSSSLIIPADPTPVPVDILTCTGPGSTGSATVSVGGVTAGYTFEWFYENVDATPDYTGTTITGLLEGTYYVKAIDNGSSCESNLINFDINDTSPDPNPSAVEVQADTECGSNNGIATADGDGAGTVAGYTFEWFVDNSTLPGDQLPAALPGSSISADGATASGLASGTYTVRASRSGCETTTTVEITDAEVIPTYNIVTQVPAGNALQVTDKAYVEMPQLLSGTSAFTISYWVEISTQNYLDDHRIFSSGGKNESQVMLWTSDVFGISFVVKAESAGSVGKINTLYKPTGWVQLTGTWDEASGEMKLYANGVKVGETTYFGDDPAILEGVIDNGPDMYLARDGNLGANKFEGRIDEVKIYNRVLDESEILTVLCDPAGGSTTGLQAHYDFNGALNTANGSTVPDVSGNGNDGIIDKPGAAPGSVQYVTSGIQCPLAGMVNNTSCDPGNPNGIIDLTGAVDPQPENYEYNLYEGTEVDPADLLATNTSGIFSDLQDGFYTVVTRDQDTNCETAPLTLSIATLPEEPSIVTTVTDNTGCTVGNGEILVTSSSVSAEPASYTYELYDGYTFATLLQTETVADGSTGFNFTGLLTGEYRIRVINDDILCESYVDVYVDDASTNPSWNHPSTIENPNSVCIGTPNGFASVAPNGNLADFTFEWYTGELVDPGQLMAGENDEFIDELSDGKYTVVATNTITGCETPLKTVTINLEPVFPNVVAVEVKPQNSCDVGDGILRAYVDEPDPSDCVECTEVDDYSFQWFLGNDTSTPLIEATDPGNNSNPTYVDSSRVEGLTGAYDYTVQVTNNLTGCTNETTISLTYDPLPPTIDAANSKVTANTLCGPSGNGSVVAAVNFVGETINGAVNDQTWDIITDCNTVTDLNSSILPDGSIELTPDVNSQAGKAYLGDSVDFSKPTRIDYWMYLGNKDNGADGITFIFHQDPAGRDALGRYGCNLGIGDEPCFAGAETAIQPSVAVEFDTYRNNTIKDPAYDHVNFIINGDMSEPQGDVGVFYNANQPRIINGQDDVEAPNTELRVTITIVPNFDGTQTFSVYVEDELRLQRTQDFINDLFGGNSKTIGGFTASTGGARNQQYVRLDPYFGEYDFDWYTGSGVDPSNEIVGADRPFLCDLLGGDYTLVVTYGGTGCTSSPPVTFTIPNDTDTATVSFSGVSNTVCDTTLAQGGNFTGSLTANIAENPADYVFAWFEGSSPSADTLSTNQTISNIPGGDYTVVVESLAGGCIATKDTTLVDVTIDPAIVDVNSDVTVNNVTVCEGAATYPNGSITVNTVGIGTGPFGFWYYYGADTTTGDFLNDGSDIFTQTGTPGTASVNVSGNGTATLTGLSAGDYTIIVVDSASGCTSIEANVNIIDVPTIPNLDQSVTPNTVCDPALAASGVYDGEVEIITTDGTDAVADYTYLWYDGTGTGTPTTWTVTDNILSEAPDGNYTVVATNTTTACDTTIYATIGDATVTPTIDNVTTQNVTACEGGPAYPNGSITVAAVTGTGPYNYLYYYGPDVATGTLLTDGTDIFTQSGTPGVASVNVNGNGTTTITGLSAGDYTIVLVDSASGCTSIEANAQIVNIPTQPQLDQNITDNTICDPALTASGNYDGEVEIVTTDATNVTDYSYVWYDGTGTGTPTVYTATNNVLSEAPDGNYTVVATSSLTGCDTTIYATIGDATTIPTIDNVTTQNVTECEGGPNYPNGSITVAAVTGTGPYNYLYYYGPDVATGTLLTDGTDIFTQSGTPGVASVNVNGNGTTTITGLSAGDYTIVLVDSASGCTSIEANAQIVNIPTQPQLDQNITDNTICDPGLATSGDYDGEVEIVTTDATNVTDYSYVWYDGTGTGTPTAYTATNNILSEAPDGNYTVVATSNLTGCDTTIYATIGDATTIPTIDNVTTQNVTECEGGPNYPNGSITVAAVTGTGPYDYLYYYGPDVATGTLLTDGTDIFTQSGTPGVASVNVNGNGTTTITGLSAGDYTIVLVDLASGCTSIEANVSLSNVPTQPQLDQNITDNTICDPGLAASGDYDGEVEIVTTDATNVTDYSYVWYDGTGTGTPTVYTATNNILSEAPDGNYTVVATSNLTGCDTTIYATIGDATTIPTIDNVTTQNVTECEGGPNYPNGSITVAAVTGTGPYDYLYYYGPDVATGTLLTDGTDIFTQSGTPGVASVNVNGNGTTTITGLSAGDYTIVLVDLASGCTSIEANAQIVNIPTIPALSQNVTPNSYCDITINNSGAYNGEVEIVTTDATNVTDYSYVWYDGTGTGTPTTYTATNNVLSEAPDGNYTVVATSNLTGCDTTIYATIGDATVDPALGTITVTDMTVCDGAAVYPNGAIDVDEPSITNGSGDYSYEFYWGPSIDPAKLLSDGDNITFEKTGAASGVNIDITNNVISNLDTGFYTIVVIDNVTGCKSGEQTVEIEDVLIAINVPAPAISHYTNCDAPDGSITVTPSMASGPEPALGYSYQWYYGSGTGNVLDGAGDVSDASALAGTTTNAVSGLEDGTYTVLITNNDTGCDTEEEYDIQDLRVYPVVDPALIVTTPNVNCSGPSTGTIDPTAAVSEPGPYVFTLYDAADVVITTEDTGGGDDGIFDGLAAANYKIGVELASGCVSVATASVSVSNNYTYPNLTVTKLSDETSCIAPNGQIRINDPGTAPAAGFDIIVYVGIGTGGAVQETIADDYTGAFPISGTANMATNTYTVQMLNNDTGCETQVQVTINNVPDRPTLVGGNVTKTNDTNCTSDNGSITVSTVTNPGVNPTFNLYSGSSIVPANLITSAQHPAANHTFSGLAAGTYTVSVIKDESGCESNGITRTVNFVPVSFTPGVTVYSDQSSCLISNPNGELIASIAAAGTGPSTSVGDYNFEWYQGQNTNPGNRITTGGIIPTAVVGSTNDSRVSGLPSGTYRLKVVEPVSGCFYVIDETIDLITTTPTIPGGGIIITDADQCAPSNGEINVTVNDGGSTQPYDGAGGYTFELYVGTIGAGETPIQTFNQTAVFGAPNYQATHTFTDLQPDDYTIRIVDNNTSCLVTSTLQTVGFVGASLAFDVNNMANVALTGCFGNDGTLDIGTSLTIPGNTDDVTITWFVGSDTSNTANLISNVVTGPPPAAFSDVTNYNGLGYDIINGIVNNLPAVSYTGVAELSNGCKFLLEVDLSIIDAPDLLTAVTTPVSRCSPTYDGEVTLTVTPNNGNNAGQYNYYLYPGTYTVTDVTAGAPWDPAASTYNGGVTAGNDGSGDGTGTFTDNGADTPDAITISELDSGTYTVIIEINTGSGCVTNVETVTIDPPTEPNVTLNTKSDNTVCDVSGALDYNGSITVDAEHPDFAGSTFTFDWYYDSDGDGDFTAGQTAVANGANGAGAGSFVAGATTTNSLSATLSGVGPGWYRVIATHTDANNAGVNATTCPDTLDIEIFDDFVELAILPAAITTQTNVLDCSGGADEFGEFLLATVREDGADIPAGGAGVNITWEYDNGGGFVAYPPNIAQNHSDDLAAGDYRITAVSTTTGCDVSYDFTIEDVTEDPVINLLSLSDNTICVGGPIGTIEADGQIVIEIQDELGAIMDPVDYDVDWYLNSIAGGNEIPATQVTGANITTTAVDVTIDDLPGGTYWVEVTKNNGDDEQCVTTASFVLIDDQPEVTIQKILNTDYTTQHNTDCSPDENGQVTLLNVYEDGVADPVANGNYLFNWFDADQVTPISVGTVGGAFNEDVTDLPAGTYYVEAENQTTDCVSDKVPFTINDERDIPNLQLAQTLPDTTCVGSLAPSGEVTASVVLPGGGTGNPAEYTFTWYEGIGTGTPITVGAVDGAAVNGEMYEQLPAGIYTVTVEDNLTPGDNCTAQAQITVSRFTPVISIQTADITIQNDLECNIDNGSATVDAVTVTKYGGGTYRITSGDAAFADFDFNWYFTATGGVSQDNDNVYDLRPAGTYYVSVSNTQTMCAMPTGVRKAVTIQDVTTLPNVQLVTKTPDEYCTTVANEGDGTLEFKIIHEGNDPADPLDYTITWYRGTGTGTTLASAPGSSVIAGSGTQLSGLSAGTYTVVVSKSGTPNDGCNTQKTFTIDRDAPTYALPESAMTIQDNQNCLNPNGTITINGIHIDGVFEDFSVTGDTYTIVWTGLPGTAVLNTVNFANDEVTALEAGIYEVDITNDRTNCTVNANIELDDIGTTPVVQLVTKKADEYCATVVPNEGDGNLNIKVVHEGNDPADPLDYVITWYRGTGTGTTLASAMGSATVSADGTTLTGLSTGTYTATVSKSGAPNDGCLTQQTFTINRDAPTYSLPLSAMTIQDNQNCLNPDGTITINGIHIDGVFEDFSTTGDTYTIVWTGLPGTAVLNTVNFANDEVTALEAGIYEVDITNDRTNCTVNANIELDDIGTTPVVQLVTKKADEYCATVTPNEGDGNLNIKVVHEGNDPADPLDYVITWYRGTGTGTTLASAMGSATVSADGTTLTGLSTGTYTATVSKSGAPNDGCLTQQTFTINRDAPTYSLPLSAMAIQDNQNCLNPDGTITINGIHIDGVFEDFSATGDTYTIAWTGLPGTAVLNTVNFANDEVTALEAGIYEVDITNDRTNCTVNANIELDDIGTTPVVQLVTKKADEYCATVTPNEGDGNLNIKVVHEGNDPADPLDYVITWYRGTGTGTTLASAMGSATVSADGTTLTGLSTGTYTATVSKSGAPNDGCLTQQTFTINRDAPTYSLPLSAMTIQDNLNCSTPNGAITINGVHIDGVFEDFSATADTYTINWTGLPGSAVLNTVNFADDQVTVIDGGTYTVDILNDRTGCTVSADITIDDITSNPLIQLVTKTPDEYCATVTPNEGDGTLNIKLVHEGNNPADSTLYTFEWFRGTGTGTALAGGALGSATISPNGTGLTGLSAGTYTVRVTDANTPNLGCLTTQTFTINRDAPAYSLPLSAMTLQDNLNCDNPNGSITINGVHIDGVFEDFSATADAYTISWTGLPGTAVLNTVNFADDQVTGIEGGTYTVDVENDRTGCTVSADVTIDDDTSNPLVQLVIKQPDEYCDNTGFQGNGSLEMRIVHEGNNPADPLDYNITWYRGTGTGTTLASTPGSSVVAGAGTQLSGLSTGTYTVVATKNGAPNDQCLTTTTFSIIRDNPQFTIQTSSVAIANNTNCTNPNGSIQITNVLVDGVTQDLATFGANYSFTWPNGYNGGTPASVNSPNDLVTDLPAGTYRIIGENIVTGCSTDTISVTILDDPTEPTLSFTMDAENTNCGPTKNGQLTVTASTADGNPFTNVGRYSFTWYDGEGTATATSYIQSDGVGANDNQSTLLALDSGYYTVEVFDNVNECTIIGTYAVSETLDVPKVLLSEIVVRADSTCDAGSSGTIIVADSSFVTGVLDDFDVEIRSGTSSGPIMAQSTAGSGNTDLTISSLDPGTFYVTATRAATECPAAPVKVIILDQRFPPAIQLDTMIANPNCGGTIAQGSIAVTADGFDETNPDYLFQWYVGTIGGGVIVPGASGGNTATMFDVAEGQYELSVTNVNTGCVATQLFNLPAVPVNPRISSYEVSNNLICNVPGDGSFEVNQIRWNGNFYDAGVTADSIDMATNYTFEYYSDAALTTPVADLDLSTPLQLDGLSAGTYYARVRRNDSQCASGPIQFTIQDLPQYPSIQLTQIAADSTCNGLNPNGTISAIVDGVANDTLYTYDWYEVDPVSGARISGSLSNNDTISGLAAGRYEVEVTGVSTGCVSTAQRNVINAPIEVEILSITSTDPTACNPPDGVIEVTSITPGILTDYTFTFYLGDPGSGGIQVQTGLGPVYSVASAGTYYVVATHDVYGCTNNSYEVVLQDNLTYPDIDLVSFENQTNCDPANPNGEITASADGSTDNVMYTFEWSDASNAVVEPNNATVSNIPAGTYTLNVTDNSTGCMSSAMFDIVDDYPDPIRLVISTSPNTNCVNPNGEVSATIRNLAALGKPITDYQFYWFNGDQTAGVPDVANPDYTGTLVTDLPDGDYTVYVVDASDAFCTSEPTLVTIQDRTLPPPFQVEIQNHVTICYDSLPDGRARINPASLEANREFFEFSYEWYTGTAADTAGQTPFVTGIRADSLDVGTYSVLSTDLRTGCENLVTFDIIDDADAVPAPDVNVVSDRDNCQFANGHATASISGTITGYRFEWFLASGDTTTVQFTGHEVFTLDSVNYTVRATRIATGCVSPKTPVEIINAIENPVFEIATTTSLCLRTEDGAFNQFTGTAEIVFSQFAAIKQIEWTAPDGSIFTNDIKLVNAQPGRWEVRFIADNDCEYFGSFGIETALKIYNGVSANADGLNDYFFIDCIDYFPNNNVQIFNRDGTKVWESDQYNNNDIRFDGFSNVGRGGLQLPAGTYFYIIEKGPQEFGTDDELTDDTIRPRIQGYLELVR